MLVLENNISKEFFMENIAFNGRILNVNLTTKEIETEIIEEHTYRELL